MRSVSMPIRRATCGSSAVACSARPVSVRLMNQTRANAVNRAPPAARRQPDSQEAPEIRRRVGEGQLELNQQLRDEHLVLGRRSLDAGRYALAEYFAQRALELVPGDRAAEKLLEQATAGETAWRARRDESLAAPPPGSDVVGGGAGRSLALAMFLPDADLVGEARSVVSADPGGPLEDEARYAMAVSYRESGSEWAMWETLDRLAKSAPEQSNMARHAAALTRTPGENPYRAFQALRREDRARKASWVLVGRYANGFPQRRMPAALQWLVESPLVVQGLMGAPMRLLQVPWMPPLPTGYAAASAARNYLARFPNGDHCEEVRDWLEAFESQRGNWIGALRVAENRPRRDADELDEFEEKAAEQALAVAERERRPDRRSSLLRGVARGFPETDAGHKAGEQARSEALEATPQRIRISRGFLRENPEVAGPQGLGLRPELLDEKAENGELHPQGVSLLGGTRIEIALLAESGDEDDPPQQLTQTVSPERLARLVARLDETSRRNALVDPDNQTGSDADRDRYFEYARLGIAEKQPLRPGSGSFYEFLGMRERYGLVRSREPLFPVDLVFQASPYDWSFGAFPRIREPKRTPDWMLYK